MLGGVKITETTRKHAADVIARQAKISKKGVLDIPVNQ